MATYLSTANIIGGKNIANLGTFLGIVANDPLLDMFEWKIAVGQRYQFDQVNEIPEATFRARNNAGSNVFPQIPSIEETIAILNWQFATDDKVTAMAVGGTEGMIAHLTALGQEALKSTYLRYLINGNANGNTGTQFNGFASLAAKHGTEVSAGTNGAALTVAMLKETVDTAMYASGGDTSRMALVMNDIHARKLWTLLKNTSTSLVTFTPNEAGDGIKSFDGVPIRVLRKTVAGNAIIPFTETQGTSSVASSIYAITFARGDLGGVFAISDAEGPTIKVVETTLGKNVAMDWGCSVNSAHTYGIVRLKGVLNS